MVGVGDVKKHAKISLIGCGGDIARLPSVSTLHAFNPSQITPI